MSSDSPETLWRIPRRLDDPLRIMMLTPIEFGLVSFGFIGGLITDTLLVCLVVLGGTIYGLRSLRGRYGDAWFIQLCFWHLPLRFKGVPYGWQRLWRG